MNARMVQCDALVRKIVRLRSQGRCERCGVECEPETAHIIRRGYSRIRCDTSNVRGLDPQCHREQHEVGSQWWVDWIGAPEYYRLRDLAQDPLWKRPRDWWVEVRDVLKVELALLESREQ